MIHKKNDILFTLIILVIILSAGIFLRHRVISEVNRPAFLIDGTYDSAMVSEKPVKDLDDYISASDDVSDPFRVLKNSLLAMNFPLVVRHLDLLGHDH